jgi:hypothetical protein
MRLASTVRPARSLPWHRRSIVKSRSATLDRRPIDLGEAVRETADQYTPAGGRIHIGVEADRAWMRLVVADSGIGMTAEEIERVFDRFYRAPNGTAAAHGTGLGLSIVESLVALHGGVIEVHSEPGRGGRSRALVVARDSAHAILVPALDELGIEYHRETTGAAPATGGHPLL